jgi:hypothetical protein
MFSSLCGLPNGLSFRRDFPNKFLLHFTEQVRLTHAGGPGSNPGLVMWDFVVDKSCAGAGSPANLHSICFSTIIFIITRGWHNRPEVAAVPIASQSTIKKKL